MNKNVANDALRAVILVEPVQGSQHTYSVEVKMLDWIVRLY